MVEDLKGSRPKGPSKRQHARFHRFQHRMLLKHLGFKAEELGLRVLAVFAMHQAVAIGHAFTITPEHTLELLD